MIYSCVGRNFHKDEVIPVFVSQAVSDVVIINRFRMIVTVNKLEKSEEYQVICLAANEVFDAPRESVEVLTQLVFHPLFLNPSYDTLDPEVTGLSAFLIRTQSQSGRYSVSANTALKLKQLISRIEREITLQPDAFWPCRTRSYLMESLMITERLFLSDNGAESSPLVDNITLSILDDIKLSYQSPPSLEMLSNQYHLNRTSIAEKFKQATGMTISNYITETRLIVAKDLLVGTLLPIEEISERIGFKEVSSFHRLFKKQIKLTPGAYRKQKTWL